MFSARPSFRLAPSAWMTLATPAIWAAACAAAPAFSPATSTCTSPPQARAAVTVLSVALLMEALSCSAITRDVMSLSSLDHFGFVLELGHQRGNVRHLDTGAALGGLGHLERLQARGDIDARSEEHTSELQSLTNLVCRLLLEKKKNEVIADT